MINSSDLSLWLLLADDAEKQAFFRFLFEELGAERWGARAAAELAATGESVRRRGADPRPVLDRRDGGAADGLEGPVGQCGIRNAQCTRGKVKTCQIGIRMMSW